MTDHAEPQPDQSGLARQWHYIPAVPIQTSPLFAWPPEPKRIARWIGDSWFTIGENLILVGIACVSWFWFQPPLEETKTLALGWIAQMWLRNFILISVVAGGLHLWFHGRKKQGDRLKYDPARSVVRGASSRLATSFTTTCSGRWPAAWSSGRAMRC